MRRGNTSVLENATKALAQANLLEGIKTSNIRMVAQAIKDGANITAKVDIDGDGKNLKSVIGFAEIVANEVSKSWTSINSWVSYVTCRDPDAKRILNYLKREQRQLRFTPSLETIHEHPALL